MASWVGEWDLQPVELPTLDIPIPPPPEVPDIPYEAPSNEPWVPITDPNDPRLAGTPLNGAWDLQPVAPPVSAPGAAPRAQAVDPYAQIRASYVQELGDPNTLAQVYNLTYREVGKEPPEAQQAFMETLFNRAYTRKKTLLETVNDRNYYPRKSYRPANLTPDLVNNYTNLAFKVVQGSDLSLGATGNASGRVMFNKGPQTAQFGRERFGTEGPDVGKLPSEIPRAQPVAPGETRPVIGPAHPEQQVNGQWDLQPVEGSAASVNGNWDLQPAPTLNLPEAKIITPPGVAPPLLQAGGPIPPPTEAEELGPPPYATTGYPGRYGPQAAPGMIAPGNIDYESRPVVHNPDGTVSTVLSKSFGTDQGTVLLPTIADDGRPLNDEQALAQYQQTGMHLGIFDSQEAADAFAVEHHGEMGPLGPRQVEFPARPGAIEGVPYYGHRPGAPPRRTDALAGVPFTKPQTQIPLLAPKQEPLGDQSIDHRAMNVVRNAGSVLGKYIAEGIQGMTEREADELVANPDAVYEKERAFLTAKMGRAPGEHEAKEKATYPERAIKAREIADFWHKKGEEADKNFGVDPDLRKNWEVRATGAMAHGAGMVGEAMIPVIGMPVVAIHGSAATYAQVINGGGTPEEAESAATRALIGLEIFGTNAKMAAMTVAKILPKGAGPLKKFLWHFGGQEFANETTSRALQAWDAASMAPPGQKLGEATKALTHTTLESTVLNTMFATMFAAHGAGLGRGPVRPYSKLFEAEPPATESKGPGTTAGDVSRAMAKTAGVPGEGPGAAARTIEATLPTTETKAAAPAAAEPAPATGPVETIDQAHPAAKDPSIMASTVQDALTIGHPVELVVGDTRTPIVLVDRNGVMRDANGLPVDKSPIADGTAKIEIGPRPGEDWTRIGPSADRVDYEAPDATRAGATPVKVASPQLAGANTKIQKEGEQPMVEVDLPAGVDHGEKINTALALSKNTRLPISWVRSATDTPLGFRGLHHEGRVFLNLDMLASEGKPGGAHPLHLIAAHEIQHGLKFSQPKLAARLLDTLATGRGLQPWRDKMRNQFGYTLEKGWTDERLANELAPEFMAEVLADPVRLRQALGENVPLMRRVANYVMESIDGMLRRLGKRQDASAIGAVRNLRASRKALLKMLREVREGVAMPAPAPAAAAGARPGVARAPPRAAAAAAAEFAREEWWRERDKDIAHEKIAEDFVERNDKGVEHIVRAFRERKPGQPFNWPVVPAARLKRIWLDFGRTGVVRDVKGLEQIKEQFLDNIGLLRASTDLMGHSQVAPNEVIEYAGHDPFTEKEMEQLGDFLTDKHGKYMLSDYGLPKLEKLYGDLSRAKTPEDQLHAIDKILNVIHQRSDLSAMFVRGGQKTLLEIQTQLPPEMAREEERPGWETMPTVAEGWMNRSGEIDPLRMHEDHYRAAQRLGHRGSKPGERGGDAIAQAQNAGNARITYGPEGLFANTPHELTQKQKSELINLAIENDFKRVVHDTEEGYNTIWGPELGHGPEFAREKEPSRLKASGHVTAGPGQLELGRKRANLEATIEGYRRDLIKRGGRNYPELRISTRSPGGIKPKPDEDPHGTGEQALHVDMESIYRDKEYTNTLAKKVKEWLPRDLVKGVRNDRQLIENAIEFMKRNKIAHYEMALAYPWFKRAMKQYEGYNIRGHELAKKYGFTVEQVLGGELALSPQTPPDESFSMVERVMKTIRESGNTRWDARFDDTVKNKKIPHISPEELKVLRGKTFNELPKEGYFKAKWARVYDQTFHEPDVYGITPEGTLTGQVATIRWRSFPAIAKGIRALEGEKLSNLLDTAKISSYYNSKIAPNEITLDWVADTHDIGTSWMFPVHAIPKIRDGQPVINKRTGKVETEDHPLVAMTFGGPTNKFLGHHGVSALHVEAGNRAAAELGVIPSDLQAGIWSHQQGFMSADVLRKHQKAIADIEKVWKDAARGKRNGKAYGENEARRDAIGIAKAALGQARAPVWARDRERPRGETPADVRPAGEPGELPARERPGSRFLRRRADDTGGAAPEFALEKRKPETGKPFEKVLFRGHIGEDPTLSRTALPTFSDSAKVAGEYAGTRGGYSIPVADRLGARVGFYRVKMDNPLVLGTTLDDVAEIGDLRAKLAHKLPPRLFDNWVKAMDDDGAWRHDGDWTELSKVPAAERELAYMDTYRVANSAMFVNMVKKAGFDGLIYRGTHTSNVPLEGKGLGSFDPDTYSAMEYTPFHKEQVQPSTLPPEYAREAEPKLQWKDASVRGSKRIETPDGKYQIALGFVGNWRGHTGQYKAIGWEILKKNVRGEWESASGSYPSLAAAKKGAAERAKEYGYDHIGYTVDERNAMSAAERAAESPEYAREAEPPPGMKERGFAEQLRKDERLAEEVRAGLLNPFYTEMPNKVTVDQALRLIEGKPIGETLNMIMDRKNDVPFRVRVAAGSVTMLQMNEAIGRLKQVGKAGEADLMLRRTVDLADWMAEVGTEAGQTIQAFAMWKQLTPEGKLQSIKRLVDRSRGKYTANRQAEIDQLKAKIDELNQTMKTDTERVAELKKLFGVNKVAKRVRPQLEKLLKAARTGRLTDQVFYDIVSERLGLPRYDRQVAAELTRMAAEIDRAPEGMPKLQLTWDMQKYIATRMGFKASDLPQSVWYGNMLSGSGTQLVNVVDTGLNTLSNVNGLAMIKPRAGALIYSQMLGGGKKGLVDAVRALAGKLRDTGGGKTAPQNITLGSVPLMEAARFGVKGGVPFTAGPEAGPLKRLGVAAMKRAAESKLGYPLNLYKYVPRFMFAMDSIMYHAALDARRGLLAFRAAQEEGLRGRALNRRVREMLGQTPEQIKTFTVQAEREGYTGIEKAARIAELQEIGVPEELSLSKEARADAEDFAAEATYRQRPKGVLGRISDGVEQYTRTGPLRPARIIVVPFTRIAANVTNRGLNYTPWGFKRAFKGYSYDSAPLQADMKAQLVVRAILGTSAMAGALIMNLRGGPVQIHGGGPKDPDKRKGLMDARWRPYSWQIGDKYISFLNTPLAIPMAIIGNAYDPHRYGEDLRHPEKALTYALMRIPNVIASQSFLKNMSDFFGAVAGNPDIGMATLQNMVSRVAGNVFPRIIKEIHTLFDPTKYDADTISQQILRDTPIATISNRPVLNAFGEEVKMARTPIEARFISQMSKDLAWRIVLKNNLRVGMPNKYTEMPDGYGSHRNIVPEEYYELILKTGPKIKSWLMANAGRYPDPAELQKALNKAAEEIREPVLERLRRSARHNPVD